MEREEAWTLLKKHLKNRNLLKHSIACEVIMQFLARQWGENEKEWALAGLLHDIDYEETNGEPTEHGRLGAEILKEAGLPEEVIRTVQAHNPEATGIRPESPMERALYAVDPVSGFIVACALIHPEKKLESLDLSFLLNRFSEKSFARGANREAMKSIESLGLSLEEFLEIALSAMQTKKEELGL